MRTKSKLGMSESGKIFGLFESIPQGGRPEVVCRFSFGTVSVGLGGNAKELVVFAPEASNKKEFRPNDSTAEKLDNSTDWIPFHSETLVNGAMQ